MKTISTLPTGLMQSFREDLLSVPMPKFREDCSTLNGIFLYLESKKYKLDKCPFKRKKYEELKQQYLELYEWAKAQEKDNEGKTDLKTEGFMYSIPCPSGINPEICFRLKGKRFCLSTDERRNNRKISKIYSFYKWRGRKKLYLMQIRMNKIKVRKVKKTFAN